MSEVLIERPEACTVVERGALVTVRRAMYDGAQLRELCDAVARVAPSHPRGLVKLMTLRLSPAFPIGLDVESSLAEMADTARALDRMIVAHAVVLEYTGVRATATRVLGRTIWTLVRPRAAMAIFDRISDAVGWLAPMARTVGALDDPAAYMRCHREAERVLGPDPVVRRAAR